MSGAYQEVVRRGHCRRMEGRSPRVGGRTVSLGMGVPSARAEFLHNSPASSVTRTGLRTCRTFSSHLGRNFCVFHKLLNAPSPSFLPLSLLWTPGTRPPVSAHTYAPITLRLSICVAPHRLKACRGAVLSLCSLLAQIPTTASQTLKAVVCVEWLNERRHQLTWQSNIQFPVTHP